MRPTWGPHGCCRPQMGPTLAAWTPLSKETCKTSREIFTFLGFGAPYIRSLTVTYQYVCQRIMSISCLCLWMRNIRGPYFNLPLPCLLQGVISKVKGYLLMISTPYHINLGIHFIYFYLMMGDKGEHYVIDTLVLMSLTFGKTKRYDPIP